jgi:hypothetical protein
MRYKMINFLKDKHLNRKVFKEYNSNWSKLSKVKSQVYPNSHKIENGDTR